MNQRKLLFSAAALFPCMLSATDYYLGSDAGSQGGTALADIAALNAVDLTPGDRVFFKAGESFSGTISFRSADAGTATNPVVFTSYGSGRATINGGSSHGFDAYNAAGVEITNLNFYSPSRTDSNGDGIKFYTDLATGAKLDYIRIDSVDVSGFVTGIKISAWHSSNPGFNDVRITNVIAEDNRKEGIATWSYWNGITKFHGHSNLYIGYSEANNNPGDPNNTSGHSGSGIVLSGVDGAVVEYCRADGNGSLNAHNDGGPIGIWCWEANDVTIQYCIASNNENGGTNTDGGGFDIDGGVTNSVIQYCYSYNNHGAGYLVAQYSGATSLNNNTIRYNISQNDGRRNGMGGIHLWSSGAAGGIQNTEIYGNTIYLAPSGSGSPSALRFQSGGTTINNTKIYNNVFITTNGLRLIRTAITAPSNTTIAGNAYFASGANPNYYWNGTTYTSLASFRTATGQETLSGANTGIEGDPQLADAGSGAALTDPAQLSSLSAYQLLGTSPLIDAGLDLVNDLSISPGSSDFFGVPIPAGTGFDVGASEFQSTVNILIDGSFDEPFNGNDGILYPSHADLGWVVPNGHKWNWNATSNWTEADLTGAGGLMQVVTDDATTTGAQSLAFDLENTSGTADLRVNVWGVNGSFSASHWNQSGPSGGTSLLANASDGNLTSVTGINSVSIPLDMASGYQYVIIQFWTGGVDGTSAVHRVDNVTLSGSGSGGTAPTSGLITFEDLVAGVVDTSFSTNDDAGLAWLFSATQNAGDKLEVGTSMTGNSIDADNNGDGVRFARHDGSAFGVDSLDFMNLAWGTRSYTLTGTLSGGGSVTHNVTNIAGRTTTSITLNWSDLVEVEVNGGDGGDGRAALDTIATR